MTALQYLDSLIAGVEIGSEIPVQLAELKFLERLLQLEAVGKSAFGELK